MLTNLSSCDKKDDPSDCGCNSSTIDTVPSDNFANVPDSEQTSGLIFYKRSENIDNIFDDEHNGKYDNRFWIIRGVEDCYNCKDHFIICNTDFVDSKFDFLKNSNDSIRIKFEGNLKYLCVDPFIAPGDYTYSEILITSIEKD